MFRTEVGDDKEAVRCIMAVSGIVRKVGTAYIHATQKQLSAGNLAIKNEAKMRVLWLSALESVGAKCVEDLTPTQRANVRKAVANILKEEAYSNIPKVKMAETIGIRYQSLNRLMKDKNSETMVADLTTKIKTNFSTKFNTQYAKAGF